MIILKKFKSIYKLLLISILATFALLSQVNAMDGKKFIEVGFGIAGGHSNGVFTGSNVEYTNHDLDETYKLDFAVGLQSEIKNIKVDYILSVTPIPVDNDIGTNKKCPNTAFTCELYIKKIVEFGIKAYLPGDIAGIVPAIYIGAASGEINIESINSTTGAYELENERTLGAAAGISLNKDLSDTTGISLDYKHTMFDRFAVPTNSPFSAKDVHPDLQVLTLRYKKFF